MSEDAGGEAVGETHPSTRTIGQLIEALDPDSQSPEQVEVPDFQRTIVWSDRKRIDLIDSIHKGYPIGALLLYGPLPGKSSDKSTYQLIDGLQRSYALKEYQASPLAFHRYIDLPDNIRTPFEQALLSADPSVTLDGLAVAMNSWLSSIKSPDVEVGFDPYRMLTALAEGLSSGVSLHDHDDLYKATATFLGELRKWVDISAMQLPILFFQGGEEDLPVVFERLNTTGTNLNRYDVLAASWVHTRTVVGNKKIQDLIEGKYKDLEDRGYEVSRKPTDDDSDYNLYEYLFGLGRLLASEYPRLFGALGDSAETPSYGFTLATVAHGLRLSRLPELPGQMRGSATLIDPSAFEKALLESVEFTDKALRPYLDIKLNSARPVDVVHAEYQMASLILGTLTLRFDRETNWTQRSTWAEVRDPLEKQLPRHYLADILEDDWRGSGDSLLYRRVWQSDEHGSVIGLAGYYNTPVAKERIEEILNAWFADDQLGRLMVKRQYVRPVEKLFLRYVYTGVVTLLDEFGTKFDLEHLFPVGRLVDAIAKANAATGSAEGWPISCVSNLALLDFRLNRQKGKLTVSEAIDALPTETEREAALGKLQHLLLCELGEIAIPKTDGSDELTRDHYEAFLTKRFQTMRALVIKNLHY